MISGDIVSELTESQVNLLAHLPANQDTLSDDLDISATSVRSYVSQINANFNQKIIEYEDEEYVYIGLDDDEEEVEELNEREKYILKSLPKSLTEIAEDLDISESVVQAHITSIQDKGHHVSYDDRTGVYTSDETPQLRSSEAISTRTRAANEWWQSKNQELDNLYRSISTPDPDLKYEDGNEDVVAHITDLHMGDLVHDDDGNETYNTQITQDVIEYITDKHIDLYDRQTQVVDIDVWHELWGGDFLTNSGIYQGQFEDLDAWLDEQHDAIVEPLMQRIKRISEIAPQINIVCKTGNHGEHRASGKSKQANADLILYKHIRNIVEQLQEHADMLQNVKFQIGSSQNYKNFEMRNGKIKGHLRHGQQRKDGYRTSAAKNEWNQTLLQHDFDLAYMGHVHRGQRFAVNGNPVFVSGSPKPSGDFAEQIAVGNDTNISTLHGVSDDGLTWVYPVDLRDYTQG